MQTLIYSINNYINCYICNTICILLYYTYILLKYNEKISFN